MDTAYQIFLGISAVAGIFLLFTILKDFLFPYYPPQKTKQIQCTYSWGEYEPLLAYLQEELLELDNWTTQFYPTCTTARHKFHGIEVSLEKDELRILLTNVEGQYLSLLADNNLLMSAEEKKRIAVPAMTLILSKQQSLLEDLCSDLPLDTPKQEDSLEDTI